MTDRHPPLTDLVGLDPNFTGGRSVEDHLRDQWCAGPHLDEAAIRERMRKAIADQIEDDCGHNPKRVCDDCDHAAKLVRRIAVTR